MMITTTIIMAMIPTRLKDITYATVKRTRGQKDRGNKSVLVLDAEHQHEKLFVFGRDCVEE